MPDIMREPAKKSKEAGPGENRAVLPSLSLPKSGGAIRGIGEKFTANPVTGTGSLSFPIFTSPGRSGFGPQLSLSYDSGSGNGPFGFGWNLSLPSITRKTDKGLPTYQDADDSDVFILSGAEDLVPVLIYQNGEWKKDEFESEDRSFTIIRYRPRTEELFARIERWTNKQSGEVHWRSISRDNITTIYGKTANSRISDHSDPERIFSWLICESYDDKGNAIFYKYKAEDSANVDKSQVQEKNRNDLTRSANRYLKHICYTNRTPRQPDEDLSQRVDWLFEVVFDYGEHDPNAPTTQEIVLWPVRKDSFSNYRAGFEVRTYRLCQRILMFHHFPEELGIDDYLVRSTEFAYKKSPIASFVTQISQSGYVLKHDGTYLKRSLPPLEFEYSQAIIHDDIKEIDAESLENLPQGPDGMLYQWADLDGEGISGILTEQAGAWFYKPNLGGGYFGPMVTVASKPSMAALSSGKQQLMDLAADGKLDLVELSGPVPGFYERTDGRRWDRFKRFDSLPNVDWNDPNLKFLDLTGDGHADIVISEHEVFRWYPSLAEDGFGPSAKVRKSFDEEKGPRLIFADGMQSIYLADMSGDGLTDLVRVRNGEVCYWPNLGYGCFGAKVMMDNSPQFYIPDQFDQRRIRLADIDGTGASDIIYLGHDGVQIYLNQSGNGWSNAHTLSQFPRIDNLSSVMVVDLLGNGTACIVWSSPLSGNARRQMRYIDLMGGQKPHLLIATKNNLGAETRIRYISSTKFYLEDKKEGRPWITRLPFPVHAVERVEVYDRISRNRFVTRYAYHHGYFDGIEREFRGFGMVEQWDTEEIGDVPQDETTSEAANLNEASFVPPVLTKTWFHTGAYLEGKKISHQLADEYYGAPDKDDPNYEAKLTAYEETLLSDTIQPNSILLKDGGHLDWSPSAEEERQACRALKGSMLRQEIYALDSLPKSVHPYSVSERNFTIEALQPGGQNQHAVFFAHPREAITYHYERNPADPRIQHALTLEVDAYGNVLKEAAIGYGRSQSDASLPTDEDRAKQNTELIIYTESRVTNAIETADTYRNPLPCEAITFELTGYTSTGAAGRYQISDLVEPDPSTPGRLRHKYTDQVAYEAPPTANPSRRPIEWLRTLYRRDDLSGLLPLGELQPLGLPGESYKLAFTPGLLNHVFLRPRAGQSPEALLPPDPSAVLGGQGSDQGGYVDLDGDGHWWIPSGRSFFNTNPTDSTAIERVQARQHFFLVRRYRDPFGQDAFVDFDAYDLLMVETRDGLDNRVTAGEREHVLPDGTVLPSKPGNDYRVLQAWLVMDPNRNRTQVAFDALGMVVGTAVMGKPEESQSDSLDGFVEDLTQANLDQFVNEPRRASANPTESEATQIVYDLLQKATTRIVYDLDRFMRLGEPPFSATIARETHVQPGQKSKLQISFSYSDGFGREIQKKIQAEPGKLVDGGPDVNPRWVGSGWTIFNNKGKPVRQYEPFFSKCVRADGTLYSDHRFEFGTMVGVSPVLFYDPVGRVVATLHPNYTYEKVVFDPWQQTTYDVNDTCAPHNNQTGDPRTDPDIQGFVRQYFKALPVDPANPWQTWHEQRIGGALGKDERNAALSAAAHADTPTTAHFDTLGRPFLTVARNRLVCSGHDLDGTEDAFATCVDLDIEGNQRAVHDERKLPVNGLPIGPLEQRIVMRYDYSMAGPDRDENGSLKNTNRIHQSSMEAGEGWMLNDVMGNPIRAWDSRGHCFRTEYDVLRRPVRQFVRGADANQSDPRTLNHTILFEKTDYGEGQVNDTTLNLRTRVFKQYDGAGVVTNEEYDFKGNLLRSSREVASEYKTIIDWATAQSQGEMFVSSTTYDALNRPVTLTTPHTTAMQPSVIRYSYNEASLLERVDANLRGASANGQLVWTPFVIDIDYNPKGQRTLIEYGSGANQSRKGVTTTYAYDPTTFRLTQLLTVRGKIDAAAECAPVLNPRTCQDPPTTCSKLNSKRCILQNLHYTYDPAGNITHIQDKAQQIIYFKKKIVEPSNDYIYDALYRLIQATGREHLGQNNRPLPHSHDDAGRTALQHPNDGKAMGRYTERYVYDAVGNFLQMQHYGSDPSNAGWVRIYDYLEPSLIEDGSGAPLKTCNRLTRTTLHPNSASPKVEPYTHDVHGSMTSMPHLSLMQWDFQDQLRATSKQVINDGTPETTYYVYDAGGQRVRKVTEHFAPAGETPRRKAERLYLGGFEVYREYNGSGAAATLVRETLHVMDDQQRIALVETRTQGIDLAPEQLIRYQIGNHLGSASLELDEQTQIISYEEYTPYGSTSYQAVRSQIETPKIYRYIGKERDRESGLYYHGTRYYAPWLGRWMSCDPDLLQQLFDSPYIYTKDNPLRYIDKDGRRSRHWWEGERPWREIGGYLEKDPAIVSYIWGWKFAKQQLFFWIWAIAGCVSGGAIGLPVGAIAGGPLGAALGLVVGMHIGFFSGATYGLETWDWARESIALTIRSGMQKAWGGIKAAAGAVWSGVQKAWGGIKTAAGAVWSGVQKAWGGIKTAAGAVWSGVQKAWGGLRSAARWIAEVVKNLFRDPDKTSTRSSGTSSRYGALSSAIENLKEKTVGRGHFVGPLIPSVNPLGGVLNPTGSVSGENIHTRTQPTSSSEEGSVPVFEPGLGFGYSFSTAFALGFSPRSSLVPNYPGGVMQPFAGPKEGFYFGFRLSVRW